MKYLMLGQILYLILYYPSRISAQDKRTQLPTFLFNTYFEVNVGYINYPFSEKQLNPGYTVESISVPHTAVRIILLGYSFNKYFSARISYMRPVLWVRYNTVNEVHGNRPVMMNIGGVTFKGQFPIHDNFIIYGEAGLGLITRCGFHDEKNPEQMVVNDANYATYLLGAGLTYQINNNWGIVLSTVFSPEHHKSNQPSTMFFAGGVSYSITPLPDNKVNLNADSDYIFPHNMIQVGYTTNVFGYGVNDIFAEGAIPVFWGGCAEVQQGISIHYQRNVYHGREFFSLDWGVSFSYWISEKNKTGFWTLSLFPMIRFTILHFKPFDIYFNYSAAGPTFISKTEIDHLPTGPKFTFQDFMGLGVYIGKNRKINTEVRIAHYSNGNIFPENEGVKIPLTFNLGYTF